MPKPVIVLAFANEPPDSAGYLRNLSRERTTLKHLLQRAEDAGLCELEILSSATLDDIFDVFQRTKFRDRIAVFHFSGHAGSQEIFVEQADGGKTSEAHSAGLMPFLGAANSLQLVFINGCLSIQQAKELSRYGVPAVIGTLQAVDDEVATELSLNFYESLADGLPIDEAWREATLQMVAGKGDQKIERYYRGLDLKEEETLPLPWEMLYRPGSEAVKTWSLPFAADNLLFGLPEIPEHYALPEVPYRFLSRYEQEDAPIFFGRARYIRDLYLRIVNRKSAPLLLLFGQSGVGKSSLLSAGLFPRIETAYDIVYLRRTPEKGLTGALLEALQLDTLPADADDLRERWLHLEATSGKNGLVVLLDQAEEAFTRPSPDHDKEWPDFWTQVKGIFDRREQRPKGKLILSYRKEYDSEIDKMAADFRIEREKIFLEKLDEKDIIEIVSGLASTETLRRHYRLQVEKGLPQEIAGNLLMDKDSAVAPVLQIILTKLWETQAPAYQRIFKKEDYRKLREEGILLIDFFQQQMAQIKAWEAEIGRQVESSGLALDLLHYHTTDYGTAESRSLEDLRQQYENHQEVLEKLIKKFQDLYLLSETDTRGTALAHDTLGRVIQQQMKDSDKPGQRAWRILQAKMAEYTRNPDHTVIEEEDLTLVEKGAAGMRIWGPKEQELILRSRKHKAELEASRRRNRYFRRIAVVVVALLAIVSTIFWQSAEREKRKVAANNQFNEGRVLLNTDPTAGLARMREAWKQNPDSAKLAMIYEAYAHDIFYEILVKTKNAHLNAAAFSVNGKFAAVATDDADRGVRVYDLASGKVVHLLSGAANPVSSVAWFRNHFVFAGSEDRQAYRWAPGNSDFLTFGKLPGRDSAFVKAIAISSGGTLFATAQDNEVIRRWNASLGAFLQEIQAGGHVTALGFSPMDSTLLAGFDDGTIALFGDKGQLVKRWQTEGAAIHAIAFSKQGYVAAGDINGRFFLWDLKTHLQILRIGAHDGGIQSLAFSADGQYLASSGADQTAKIWQMPGGRLVNTLRGHKAAVHSVFFSEDAAFLLTASEDGTIRRWAFAYEAPLYRAMPYISLRSRLTQFSMFRPSFHQTMPNGGTVTALDWLPDGRVLAATRSGYCLLWNAKAGQTPDSLVSNTSLTAIAAAPDGRHFATGDRDGGIKIWEIRPDGMVKIKEKRLHRAPADALAFAPDGRLLLSGSEDGTAGIWLMNSDKAPLIWAGHQAEIKTVAMTNDGKTAVTAALDGTVRSWNAASGAAGNVYPIPEDFSSATIGLSGKTWALATGDSILWCTTDMGCRFRNIGKRPVISPDGEYYASINLSGNAAELRTKEGLLCKTFHADKDSDRITCLAFERNGYFLAAGTTNGKLLVWRNDRLKLE